MIQRSRIHCEGIGYSVLRTRAQASRAIRRRNGEAARVADRHAVGRQHTIRKGRRGSTPGRKSPRGCNVYGVPCTVEACHRVVTGILSRDLDIERYACALVRDGPSTNRLH